MTENNNMDSEIEMKDSDIIETCNTEIKEPDTCEHHPSSPSPVRKRPYWKTKSRLFPIDRNVDFSALQTDDESLNYITIREAADEISDIILSHCGYNRSLFITDATAGVGGNTLSFCSEFAKVRAIELDEKRSQYLHHNLACYGFHNCEIEQGDCTDLLFKMEQDIVNLDPPWGGAFYRDHKSLRLTMSDIELEDLCLKILRTKTRIIALKLPVNYDLQYLYDKLSRRAQLYLHNLNNKMLIVVLCKRL
jgi:predicted RNA methylase